MTASVQLSYRLFSWKQRLWFEENLADFDADLLARAGESCLCLC